MYLVGLSLVMYPIKKYYSEILKYSTIDQLYSSITRKILAGGFLTGLWIFDLMIRQVLLIYYG